jgi:Ca2+-binding RTX toxin-like protein
MATAVTVDLTSAAAIATHLRRNLFVAAAGQAANLENVTGGSGNDRLTGNAAANVLLGNAGDDHLVGGDGSDLLQGGIGNDVYTFRAVGAAAFETDTVVELAGQGTDKLDFSELSTFVSVNLNSDTALATHSFRKLVTGGAGQAANLENAIGGSGKDTLIGNAAANVLTGNAGDDTLVGGDGNDVLLGGAGADKLTGGAGNDRLTGGSGDDAYIFQGVTGASEIDTIEELAGGGVDSLSFSDLATSVTVDLNLNGTIAKHLGRKVVLAAAGQGANLEVIVGGSAADRLTGNAAVNWISGNGGDDVITGGGGDDTLLGRDGNDTLIGGTGNDRLIGGDGDDILIGNAGDDTYQFDPVASAVAEVDTISEYTNAGSDTLDFSNLATAVTVNLNQVTVATHARRTVKVGALAQAGQLENVIGGSAGDNITGNGAVNVLVGNSGNDTLLGGGNRDILIGGYGADVLRGGPNQDLLIAGGLSYQYDPVGLSSIRNEWQQATSLQARIDHLMGAAGGLNGSFAIKSTTVVNDAQVDSLFGEGDLDWFWTAAAEVKDLAAGERRDP